MRKLVASMNMTLDGYCDHTSMIADDEIHEHYNDMLRNAGALMYGRTTYQLMEAYWPMVAKTPTGNKATDDFGVLIDNIQKIVFSRSLTKVDWKNTLLKNDIVKEEILSLKQQPGKDLFVGSPSLIVATTRLGLVDEYWIHVQPTIVGSGLTLFKNITERVDLKLLKTKIFKCGAVSFYYETIKK